MSDEDDSEYANIDEGIECVGRLSQELVIHITANFFPETTDDDFDLECDFLESSPNSLDEVIDERKRKRNTQCTKKNTMIIGKWDVFYRILSMLISNYEAFLYAGKSD